MFVKVANTAYAWAGLAMIDGVLSVLGTAECPAPNDDMLKPKMKLEHDETARDIITDAMKVWQQVRVTDGPFGSFPRCGDNVGKDR